MPLPGFAVGQLGSVLRQARLADFSPEQLELPDLRSGHRHHPDAHRARLRARRTRPPRRSPTSARLDAGLVAHRRACRRPALGRPAARRPRPGGRRPVADAEIIPLGTRGPTRPRHGQRQAVLGRPQPGRPQPAPPGRKAAARKPRTREPRDAASKPAAGPRPSSRSPPRPCRRAAPPSAPPRPAATTADRGALGRASRRPMWLVDAPAAPPARSSASSWEPQLAQLLAFLRRRLTGDYEVDEFGFDPELTEQVFLPLLRPLAEKWFRVEVRGIENIPADGGALVVSNHSGTMPLDALMTDGRRPRPHRPATCGCSAPTWSSGCRSSASWPARAAPPWPATRTPSGCCAAASWSASGPRASRASASRSPSATSCSGSAAAASSRRRCAPACRSSRCSVVGAEEIYPLVGNIPSLARLLGRARTSRSRRSSRWLGPARPGPAAVASGCIEFGEPIRTDELRRRRRRRPDAGLQRHRPGARDDPADPLHAADAARSPSSR